MTILRANPSPSPWECGEMPYLEVLQEMASTLHAILTVTDCVHSNTFEETIARATGGKVLSRNQSIDIIYGNSLGIQVKTHSKLPPKKAGLKKIVICRVTPANVGIEDWKGNPQEFGEGAHRVWTERISDVHVFDRRYVHVSWAIEGNGKGRGIAIEIVETAFPILDPSEITWEVRKPSKKGFAPMLVGKKFGEDMFSWNQGGQFSTTVPFPRGPACSLPCPRDSAKEPDGIRWYSPGKIQERAS